MVTKTFQKVMKILNDYKEEYPEAQYISQGRLYGEMLANIYSDPYRAKYMINGLEGMGILHLDTSVSPKYKINWEIFLEWKLRNE